jgi:medium-chain acyl-[acyl-carrier-protein] hydrolase
MGAMLAYRTTLALRQRGAPLPQALAVASWPPQGASQRVMPDPASSDTVFTADLRRLGGVPDELLDDPSMTKLALPILRADFRLCRSYVYRPAPPLRMPVIALGGDTDLVTPAETLATWREEAADFRGLHLFPGGHFFLAEHAAEVADLVIQTACSPGRPRAAARGLPTPPR